MQILTTLDLLFVVLTVFITIIGVLLVIALLRLIKILGVVQEITDYYYTVKKYVAMYSQIPELVKDKVLEIIGRKK
ncbi:MAG: hypothetical protein PHH06_03065 [Candidatus Gracilibacteria bacterium]|nr:hypothetical protein [Candidatus Gracilibacteria bacterium]